MPMQQTVNSNAGDKLLRVLMFTLVISVMNASMFNVVLPVISKQFDLTPSQVSWIVTSYMIVYAIGSVTFGKLADKYRLKDLLTFGLLFFAAGSVVGMAATEYWMIIAGRILQATGASVIPATAMIVPVRYFAPEKRGSALGTVAVGLALGTAIGPIVSGFVTSVASWRFLFAISIFSLLTLPYYRKYLDDTRGAVGKIDFIGGILLAGTVAAMLLAITQMSLWLFLSGAALLALFLARIRYAKEPFVKPSIFRNKQYTLGLIVAFVMTGLSFGIPFMTPQLLSSVNHMSPAFIGFVMFPGAIMSALMGRKGGKLADQKGNPFLVFSAASLIFAGFISLSSIVGMSPVIIAICLIFGNVGQTFMQIAMSNTVSRTLSKEEVGVGMGMLSMLNFISGATATALIGKTLDFGAVTHWNPLAHNNEAFVYSNIFLALAILVVLVTTFYYMQFGGAGKRLRAERNAAQ
ncbi:antiporter [Paenibacillus contaminans]|uniref:Antiporter n=2 Tax=Paenibacillus contaminans TaxID=450362 RepID=A0A329MU03_9BACL|nr:MFS transporter [Paenibacillus contaminans]RAV22828.1 antiporter [Paenibacillus contaminans]